MRKLFHIFRTLPATLFSFLFLSISLHAVELVNETFNSNITGWTVSSTSKVYWTSTNNNSMFIDQYDSASKTYIFGASYADQALDVEVYWCATSPWESNQDYLRIRINDSADFTHYDGGGCQLKSFTTNADSSGNFKIEFSPRASASDEDAYIDWFTVNGTPLVEGPPLMQDVPNQTAMVSTYFSLNIANYVTLTNGDPILANGYTLTGTLPTWLSFDSNTGILSGTPTAVASAESFTITATDNDGESNEDTFTVTVAPQQTETTGGRNFSQRTQFNLFGDVKVIGNTVVCKLSNGSCVEPTSTTDSNAQTDLQKAPLSYATLTIPTNATIKYARIYWQGRAKATSTDIAWDSTSKTLAGTIGIRKGTSGAFTNLTADSKDFDSTRTSYYDTSYTRIYSASADASAIVNGSGSYYIDTANYFTHIGKTVDDSPKDGLGVYGAWVLVVIYDDLDETKARNITVFDGYKQVTSTSGDVPVDVYGFLTPKTNPVDSTTYVFTAEGDKYISGDLLKMAGDQYSTSFTTIGSTTNEFDSTVDINNGSTSPTLTNNNGIDIHKYNTGTTSGALNKIQPNETGAHFEFTSTGDTYFPSLIVFSTELYLPQLCYDYSIKQDGQYLPVDRDSYPIAQLDSTISSSNVDIVVYLRNNEADLAAQGISIKADSNDTIFDFVGNTFVSNTNGSTLLNRGTPTSTMPLCEYDKDGNNELTNIGCTDGHDVRKGLGSLDAQDYVYFKYQLEPKDISGLGDINTSLGLSLKYYIVAGGNKIEYPEYILGSENVPLCPPTSSYQPTWGQFNVVQRNLQTNNLNTQISRKPFDVDVIFDSSPSTGNNEAPTVDIETTVLVEMIDIDAFGDINASCANPDSSLSDLLVVPLTFNNSVYQSPIPTQTTDYYDFAVKNGAFRVWYFVDSGGALITNWTATTDINGRTVTAINGLYNSTIHTQCSSDCSDASSPTCLDCIKANYGQPLCSRDNFSVRPESFDLRIYDINHALPAYNIDTNPTNLKNTTKIDLSTLYQFTPIFGAATGFMQLAAEYNYRFDITATGHDNLNPVSGYTRNFKGGIDYFASFFWNPQSVKTGCNDTANKSISFYVANGSMQNEERNQTQVGEYSLNITDTSWTAVDQINLTHHDSSASGGFLIGTDCVVGSTSSTLTGNRHGCNISSNHTNDDSGLVYKNHAMRFHPYRFNIDDVNMSYGINNSNNFLNAFVYMSDMSINSDENMSVHMNGPIMAQGEGNTTLSNFVDNCYAEPLDIALNRTNVTLPVAYQYRLKTRTNTNANIRDTGSVDLNNSVTPIQLLTSDFVQLSQGITTTIFNLNYNRRKDTAINPEAITFNSYSVSCTTAANCTFNADLINNQQATGAKNLNNRVVHYYGRSHTIRQKFSTTDTSNPTIGTAFIDYETYCDNDGNKTLLQDATLKSQGGDPRWFINPNHIAGFGSANAITQKGAARVTATNAVGIHQDSTNLTYDASKGYPYTATMQHNSDGWLIYNKYNNVATTNEFDVEFTGGSGAWVGKQETNSTTNTNAATSTNRRIMW